MTLTLTIPAPCDAGNKAQWINANHRMHRHVKADKSHRFQGFRGIIEAAPGVRQHSNRDLTPSLDLAERGWDGFYLHHTQS